jgi:antitoxin VapB
MALSLKNPETERLAKELAHVTGESVTRAVTIALQERLERQERSPEPGSTLRKLIALSNLTAPLFTDGKTSKEMFDELYDEDGLPK